MTNEAEFEGDRAQRAIGLLANARDAASVERLAQLVGTRPDLRRACIMALGRIGGDEALAVLGRLLEDDAEPNVDEVIEALAATKSPRGRDLLLWYLIHELDRNAEEDTLVTVLEAFTELPIHRGAAILIHLLAHLSPMVRRCAVWALSGATEPAVVDALIVTADADPEEEVRSDALAVLRALVTPAHADWLWARWTNAASPRARADALTAFLLLVGRTPDGHERERLKTLATQAIRAALEDPSKDVALAAAMHSFVAGPDVAEPLLKAMAEREALREFAIVTLGHLGYRPAAPTLMQLAGAATGSVSDEALPELNVPTRVAQRAAEALAALDPHALLQVRSPIAQQALAHEARRQQWLVYDDRIAEEWPGSPVRLVIGRRVGTARFDAQPLTLTEKRHSILWRLAKSPDQTVSHVDLNRVNHPDEETTDMKTIQERCRKAVEELREQLKTRCPSGAAALAELLVADEGAGYRLCLDRRFVEAHD